MKGKETYHHGDLEQKILEEALSWIERENIASLSLRGIARNLGVSHNAPYRHFPDKESLLIAIAVKGFEGLHQTLQQASYNHLNDPHQRLQAIGVAYIEYAVQHQAYYRVMFGDRQKSETKSCPTLQKVANKTFAVLEDTIKRGQTREVFIEGETEQLARVCWSLVHGVSMLAIDRQLMISDSQSVLELARIATKTVSQGLSRV
jgi:AcrR family transcriptional regulator